MTNIEIAPLPRIAIPVVGPTSPIVRTSRYREIVMGLQAAIAIGVFAAFVGLSVVPAHATPGMHINPAAELDTTQIIDHRGIDPDTFYRVAGEGDVPDLVADCLTALGWSGKDDDGMAAIYAPTVVIKDCGGTVSR